MAKASRHRSICLRNPTACTSVAARRGARVFPAAVTTAASAFGVMGRLTRNAPSAIAGHMRRPNTRKATNAIPVGGHSGVTLRPTTASLRLSLAAT